MALKIPISTKESRVAVSGLVADLKSLGVESKQASKKAQSLENRLKKGLQAQKADKALKSMTKTLKLSKLELIQYKLQLEGVAGASKMFLAQTKAIGSSVVSIKNMFLGLGVSYVTADIVRTGAAFEQVITEVGGLTNTIIGGVVTKQFQSLRAEALKLGETTEYMAKQVGSGMKFLAMSGQSVDEVLGSIGGMLDLATAGGLELARASDIATNALKSMKLEVSAINDVSDTFIRTITSSNTDMEMLAEAFKYSAGIAAGYGYEIEQLSAALGMLGNTGIQGSMAGTQMAVALQRLDKVFVQYGQSAVDSAGQSKQLIEALELLEQKSATTADIMSLFAARGGRAMVALYSMGSKELKKYTKYIQQHNRDAKILADIMRSTTTGSFKELSSAIESVKIGLFEANAGGLNDLLKSLTRTVRDNKGAFLELSDLLATDGVNAVRSVKDAFVSWIPDLDTIFGYIQSNPQVAEYGLVGLLVGGTKGAIVGAGIGHLEGVFKNIIIAMDMVMEGRMKFSEFASSNSEELAVAVTKLKDPLVEYELELKKIQERSEELELQFSSGWNKMIAVGQKGYEQVVKEKEELKQLTEQARSYKVIIDSLKTPTSIDDSIQHRQEQLRIAEEEANKTEEQIKQIQKQLALSKEKNQISDFEIRLLTKIDDLTSNAAQKRIQIINEEMESQKQWAKSLITTGKIEKDRYNSLVDLIERTGQIQKNQLEKQPHEQIFKEFGIVTTEYEKLRRKENKRTREMISATYTGELKRLQLLRVNSNEFWQEQDRLKNKMSFLKEVNSITGVIDGDFKQNEINIIKQNLSELGISHGNLYDQVLNYKITLFDLKENKMLLDRMEEVYQAAGFMTKAHVQAEKEKIKILHDLMVIKNYNPEDIATVIDALNKSLDDRKLEPMVEMHEDYYERIGELSDWYYKNEESNFADDLTNYKNYLTSMGVTGEKAQSEMLIAWKVYSDKVLELRIEALKGSSDWLTGIKLAIQKAQSEIQSWGEYSYNKTMDAVSDIESGMSSTFQDWMSNNESMWENMWSGMKDYAIQTVADIVAKVATQQLIMPLVINAMGGSGSSGILGYGMTGIGAYSGIGSTSSAVFGGGSSLTGGILSGTNTASGTVSGSSGYVNDIANYAGYGQQQYLDRTTGEVITAPSSYGGSEPVFSSETIEALNTVANVASMVYGGYLMNDVIKNKDPNEWNKDTGFQPGNRFSTYAKGTSYFIGGLQGMLGGGGGSTLTGFMDAIGFYDWMAEEMNAWFSSTSMMPLMSSISDNLFNWSEGQPHMRFDNQTTAYGTPYSEDVPINEKGYSYKIRGFSDDGELDYAVPMMGQISNYYEDYTNRLFISTNDWIRQNFDDAATNSIMDTLSDTSIKWDKQVINFYDPETNELLDIDAIKANIESGTKELMTDMYMKVLPVVAQQLADDELYKLVRDDVAYQLPLERFLEDGANGLSETVTTPEEMEDRIAEFETYMTALEEIRGIWDDTNSTFDQFFLDGQVSQFSTELESMDSALQSSIDNLRVLGFTEEALVDLERKRVKVLDDMRNSYWLEAETSINSILTPTNYSSTFQSIFDSFDEWELAAQDTGDSIERLTSLEILRAKVMDNTYEDISESFLGSGLGVISSAVNDVNESFIGLINYLYTVEDSNEEIARYKSLWKEAAVYAAQSGVTSLQTDISTWKQSIDRESWEKSDWEDEFTRLEEQYKGLDPETTTYRDDQLTILEDQFSVLKSIESITEDSLSVAEQTLSTAQADLESATSSVESLDSAIFDLTSGSLAAVQSSGGYQIEYDRLLNLVEDEGTEDALNNFLDFATGDYLSAMTTFGYDQQQINDTLVDDFKELRISYQTEQNLLEELVTNTQNTVDALSSTGTISGNISSMEQVVSTETTLSNLFKELTSDIGDVVDNNQTTNDQRLLSDALSVTSSNGIGGIDSSNLLSMATRVGGYSGVDDLINNMSSSSIAPSTRELNVGSGTLYLQSSPFNDSVYAQYTDSGETFQSQDFIPEGLTNVTLGPSISSTLGYDPDGEFNSPTVEGHMSAISQIMGVSLDQMREDYLKNFQHDKIEASSTPLGFYYSLASGGGNQWNTPDGENHGWIVSKVSGPNTFMPFINDPSPGELEDILSSPGYDTKYSVELFERGGLATKPSIFADAEPEWAVPTYNSSHSENFLRSVGVDKLIESLKSNSESKEIITLLRQLIEKEDRPLRVQTETNLNLDGHTIAKSTNEQVRRNPKEFAQIANKV